MHADGQLLLAKPLAQQDDGVDESFLHVTMVHCDEHIHRVLAIHHPACLGNQLVDQFEEHDSCVVPALGRPTFPEQDPLEISGSSGDDAISTVAGDVADAA